MGITDERRRALALATERWRDSIELADLHRGALHTELLLAVDEDGASPRELAGVLGVSQSRIHALIAAAARADK